MTSLDTSTLQIVLTELLHDLGPWASAPILGLALLVREAQRRYRAKDAEIASLRRQIADLQEKRLQEAREMIRIAETGAEATTRHTQSDERIADLLEAVLRRNTRSGLFGWRS